MPKIQTEGLDRIAKMLTKEEWEKKGFRIYNWSFTVDNNLQIGYDTKGIAHAYSDGCKDITLEFTDETGHYYNIHKRVCKEDD